MADLHEHESEFSRLLRQVPCDDVPRPEHADALREQALAAFDRAAASPAAIVSWKHALNQGRELMRRPIPRLIAFCAACATIAAVWLLVPGQQSTAQAFNTFANAVIAAKTAKFEMEVNIEGQPKQKCQAYFLSPGRYRQEFPAGIVNVMDMRAGKIVNLAAEQKKAFIMNFKGAPKDGKSHDHFERLQRLLSKTRDSKDDQFEELGTRKIDGQQATGFRIDTPAETVTMWGDPASGLPVRIETVYSGIPRTEVAMTNFVFNVDVKESLFDTTPPADYKVQSFDVDLATPVEADLVQAFRTCLEFNNGVFPDSLDTTGISQLIIKHIAGRGKAPTDDEMQQLMKQSIAIGRGFQFALSLPESAEVHYAGKEVKQDAKDRPVFWYKPAETKPYRVIYADLSVKDTDRTPQVEGAKRLERASKTVKPEEK
jgi:outer membrane lipoprotein-sorting protein